MALATFGTSACSAISDEHIINVPRSSSQQVMIDFHFVTTLNGHTHRQASLRSLYFGLSPLESSLARRARPAVLTS